MVIGVTLEAIGCMDCVSPASPGHLVTAGKHQGNRSQGTPGKHQESRSKCGCPCAPAKSSEQKAAESTCHDNDKIGLLIGPASRNMTDALVPKVPSAAAVWWDNAPHLTCGAANNSLSASQCRSSAQQQEGGKQESHAGYADRPCCQSWP